MTRTSRLQKLHCVSGRHIVFPEETLCLQKNIVSPEDTLFFQKTHSLVRLNNDCRSSLGRSLARSLALSITRSLDRSLAH